MDFSETILIYDVSIGRCSELNEYMNLYEYQMSGHSLTFSSETARPIEAKFHVKPPWDKRMKICSNV